MSAREAEIQTCPSKSSNLVRTAGTEDIASLGVRDNTEGNSANRGIDGNHRTSTNDGGDGPAIHTHVDQADTTHETHQRKSPDAPLNGRISDGAFVDSADRHVTAPAVSIARDDVSDNDEQDENYEKLVRPTKKRKRTAASRRMPSAAFLPELEEVNTKSQPQHRHYARKPVNLSDDLSVHFMPLDTQPKQRVKAFIDRDLKGTVNARGQLSDSFGLCCRE